MDTVSLSPVKSSRRYMILDSLRGFALLGICMANFPEISLFTFLGPVEAASLPASGADRAVRFLLYLFVDGKFYTIFSLLFGIGFSIIISNAVKKGADGFRIFYRRMAVLALAGLLHLMLIWSGDILLLYALMGMLLPLFRNLTDRALLGWAAVLLVLPVAVDTLCRLTGTWLSAPVVELQQACCARYGITDGNFAFWLRDAQDYGPVLKFLVQGALVRVQEFVDGNRYFKVLGLFLIGFYIGRRRIYADLEDRRRWLKRIFLSGTAVGLPLSAVYAWSCMQHHPFGLPVHSVLYLASVYPLGFAYVAGICLMYLKWKGLPLWGWLAAPGRMALTNYIGQSVAGMFIFYGIGLGLGASVSLACTEAVVLAVYIFQIVFSLLWLRCFQFGPLEWVWRMLTYGRRFRLRKQPHQ